MTDDRARVCVVTEIFFPDGKGGIQTQAYQLAEQLIARGVSLFVVTRYFVSGSAPQERVGNVPVIRVGPRGMLKDKGWRALGPLLFMVVRFFFFLLRNADRYDVMVVHSAKLLPIPAIAIARIANKKCIVKIDTAADLVEAISNATLKRMGVSSAATLVGLWRRFRAELLRRADCIIAISDEIHRGLLGLGVDAQRIRLIPNGTDMTCFRPVSVGERDRLRERLHLPTDRVLVIYTGRLTAAKGLMELAEAWKEVAARWADVHLVVVGTGRYSHDDCEPALREVIARYELQNTVTFTGEVSNVHEFLQAADLFVLPSYSEGFSLSLLEAMACGLPVVSTRVGSAPETIVEQDNGLLVAPKNAEDLAHGLAWLLSHRECWAAIGARARQTVAERYSLGRIADRYVQLFQTLCT
jgi:glycosyltransferase involved in cell wall biosynthesis